MFSFIGLLMVLKSFAEKSNVEKAWLLVIMNHFWVALAIAFNENFDFTDIHLYLSGVLVAGVLGYACIKRLKYLEKDLNLAQYQGYAYRHPILALSFLLSCLGLSGFPITPTFIGEDLIFSHIHEDQIVLACFVTLSFIIDGLSIIRMYARLFLGPHIKSPTEMAYRSA
jgi:NADH:ubiquinone oxidoreductase subunit 2 (subunit N)